MEISLIAKHLLWFFLLLISLTLHEWGHAFVADKLGDPTPRQEGRVSLNPLVHIDIFGTIIFPLLCIFLSMGVLFGWGRPVTLHPSYFKKPEWHAALAGSAGLLGNFLLCTIAALVIATDTSYQMLAYSLLELNAILIAINLFPIPGLDGFYFIKYIVKPSNTTISFLENWGFFILLLLINIPIIRLGLSSIANGIISIFIKFSFWVHGIFV